MRFIVAILLFSVITCVSSAQVFRPNMRVHIVGGKTLELSGARVGVEHYLLEPPVTEEILPAALKITAFKCISQSSCIFIASQGRYLGIDASKITKVALVSDEDEVWRRKEYEFTFVGDIKIKGRLAQSTRFAGEKTVLGPPVPVELDGRSGDCLRELAIDPGTRAGTFLPQQRCSHISNPLPKGSALPVSRIQIEQAKKTVGFGGIAPFRRVTLGGGSELDLSEVESMEVVDREYKYEDTRPGITLLMRDGRGIAIDPPDALTSVGGFTREGDYIGLALLGLSLDPSVQPELPDPRLARTIGQYAYEQRVKIARSQVVHKRVRLVSKVEFLR